MKLSSRAGCEGDAGFGKTKVPLGVHWVAAVRHAARCLFTLLAIPSPFIHRPRRHRLWLLAGGNIVAWRDIFAIVVFVAVLLSPYLHASLAILWCVPASFIWLINGNTLSLDRPRWADASSRARGFRPGTRRKTVDAVSTLVTLNIRNGKGRCDQVHKPVVRWDHYWHSWLRLET